MKRTPANEPNVRVRFSADRRTAHLEVTEQHRRPEVTLEALLATVTENGVVIDTAVEQRIAVLAQRLSSDGGPADELIADVRAQEIDWTQGHDPTSPPAPLAEGDGVDHYTRVSYVKVAAGARVGSLAAPAGRIDVTGTALPPDAPAGLAVDEGTLSVSPDGVITATIDGVLMIESDTVLVSRRLVVPGHVDFSTGSIDFDGCVDIRAGVRGRFVVKATEDLLIAGLVEAATLVSGGVLCCRQGMAAKEHGQITVGTCAEFGYLNNVHGTVAHDLTVRRELLNCQLAIGGDLLCPQAAVIGGRVEVSGRVSLRMLGSPAGVPTSLVVGVGATPDIGTLGVLLDRLGEELAAKKARYEARKQTARDHKAKEKLMELGFELHEQEERLAAYIAKRDRAAAAVTRGASVDVAVEQCIHAGAILVAGDTEVQFERDLRGPVTLSWDDEHRVQYRQAGNSTRPLVDIARVVKQAA